LKIAIKKIEIKKPLRICVLAILIASCARLPISAYAESSAAEPSQSSGNSAQAAPEHPEGGQEAAGEEKDQTEQFKHSSSVRLIGRIVGLDSQRSFWIASIINFAVMAGIILWAGRKFLPTWMQSRTLAIQKAMQEAQKASAESRQKLAEIESRLQKLDAEIAAMRDAAEKEGAAEEARIHAAAKEDAHKIVVTAEQEIAAAAKAARRQLTAHAADLAVGLAQKQIRVDAGTDQALVRNFAGELGATGTTGKDRN
jgi:F-type H+-transporting ATPase subunit b